jgi:endonuclease YncB( thermonuclease family)
MSRREEYVAFRPRRRAFASRRKPLASLGSWGMALAGAAFGGAVTAGLLGPLQTTLLAPAALFAPPIAANGAVADEPAVEPTRGPTPRAALSALPASTPGGAGPDTSFFDTQTAAPTVTEHAAAEPNVTDVGPTGQTAPLPAAQTGDQPTLTGRPARIVDGDTFYLEGVKSRLRVWGVDAPEKDEAGFAEATQALTSLIAGRTLACEEMDRDRYQRIVARCTLEDGRDIARVMIDIGAASEMVRYSGGYYGG